jgi:hypothetical protein
MSYLPSVNRAPPCFSVYLLITIAASWYSSKHLRPVKFVALGGTLGSIAPPVLYGIAEMGDGGVAHR